MKIRNGFVSNSSSSSFLIYGTPIETEKVKEALLEDWKTLGESVNLSGDFTKEDVEDAVDDYSLWDFEEQLNKKFPGLNIHGADDFMYLGLSWDDVRDDETGLEFKTRIEEAVAKIDPKAKCGTHSEAWYDG
jgi:hypothetical protein